MTPRAVAVVDVVPFLNQVIKPPGLQLSIQHISIRPNGTIFLEVARLVHAHSSSSRVYYNFSVLCSQNLDHLSFLQSMSLIHDIDKILTGPRDSNHLDF